MQGQTKIQERLRGIQSLIHEIEEVRNVGEVTMNKLSQNQNENIKQALQEAEKEVRSYENLALCQPNPSVPL